MKIRKAVAALLAAVMTMSAAGSVLAAPSPVTPTPSQDGYKDINEQDHSANKVESVINQDLGTAYKAESTGGSQGEIVRFSIARNSKNEAVPITVVGNGQKGVFNSKKGRKITRVIFSSEKDMVVKKLTFKGSKIKQITLKTNVTFSKNAFKGTKTKKITLRFSTKKASSIKLKKGAFNGLTKVTVKGLSKKEYNKLLKAAKKAGIKTSIFKKG